MTTAATRMREIAELEGFEVVILDGSGQPLDPKTQGLPSYRQAFQRAASNNWTVSEWKEQRFKDVYLGYDVQVLMDDGTIARGNTTLRTVRESYEEPS